MILLEYIGPNDEIEQERLGNDHAMNYILQATE